MTPMQFAALVLWAFFTLGAIIHVNVESAIQATGLRTTPRRPLFITEHAAAILAAASGGLLWWWIA